MGDVRSLKGESGERKAQAGRDRNRAWIARRWLTGPGLRGAAIGLVLAALAIWLMRVIAQAIPGAPGMTVQINAPDLAVALACGVLVMIVLTVVALIIRRRIPAPFVGVAAGAGVLVGTMAPGPSPLGWPGIAAVLLIAAALIGGWVGSALAATANTRTARGPGRIRSVITATAAVLALGIGVWLAYPGGVPAGTDGATSADGASGGGATTEPIDPGEYEVRQLTYGNGQDQAVARYGPQVEYQSATVDASTIVDDWGPENPRTQVWGFDATELPLNGSVWAPAEQGTYPLVLILHGNAGVGDSELGYDYLAQDLAARGYIVASIDENFLNTSILDRAGPLANADQLRGWLVLQHLALWKDWAQSADFPLEPDLDEVTLIGHSRGGEAVSVAAAVLTGDLETDLPAVDLPEVNVGTVIALAPSDGLIAAETPLTLSGVNYLTIAGTHDADINTLAGAQQYNRVDVGSGGIKGAVALHRGNHSQMNSLWGRYDSGAGLSSRVLNTGVLVEPEQERNAVRWLVAAFLADAVGQEHDVRQWFGALIDPELTFGAQVRAAWSSEDGQGRGGFDEDEPAQVPAAGLETDLGILTVSGADGQVMPLPTRVVPSQNAVLAVSAADDVSRVDLDVSASDLDVGAEDRFAVDLADAAASGDREGDVAVHLVGADGSQEVSCELSMPVRPTLDGQLGKVPALMPLGASEPFLATSTVSLDCLAEGGLDLAELTSLSLQFEGAGPAGVYVDNLRLE